QKVSCAQGFLWMYPDGRTPDCSTTADSIEDLAAQIGIDPEALAATVERHTEHAARGEGPDFDRHRYGLMAPGQVAPIDTPPYYAVEIYPGALGTNGGPRIDRNAQVRRRGGGLIGGLYAAGNTAANVFGWAYPSGACTIGHPTVFGYRAGSHPERSSPHQIL